MSDIVDINGIPFGDLSKVNAIEKANFSSINGIDADAGGIDWGSFTGDDFTGTNGDLYDTEIWKVYFVEGDDPWEIQDNQLRITVDPNDRNDLVSTFSLEGDFDVEIDYTLLTYPSTNEWQITLLAIASPEDQLYGVRIRHSYYNGHRILHKAINGGSSYDVDQVPTSVTTAKLRIVRVDNNFTSYHGEEGTTFMKTSAVSGANGKDFQFIIRGFSSSSNPAALFDIDNFTINSGTVVPPI
jgi:hypothetical protein